MGQTSLDLLGGSDIIIIILLINADEAWACGASDQFLRKTSSMREAVVPYSAVMLRGKALLLQDRLDTLDSVRKAGISVCAGGIIGMGEGNMDRVGLLHQLATLPEHPESVPINALVAVKGTPLQVRLSKALGTLTPKESFTSIRCGIPV